MTTAQAPAHEPQPASNLRDATAGAAWTYLLESLELEAILTVGRPGSASARTLERVARRVRVVDDLHGELPTAAFDLIYVTPASARILREPSALTRLIDALTPRGQLVVEDPRAAGGLPDASIPSDEFWVTPARGEVRSAVPLLERGIRDFFIRAGITVPSMPRAFRIIDRVAPVAASRGRTIAVTRPRGPGLSTGRTGISPTPVPAYVRAIAKAAGIELDDYRFGLSARGRYSSRKVVFYLFGPEADGPAIIVKTTRDPVHNGRLSNEEAALRHVASSRLADPGTYPAVQFAGTHGGLQLVGEEAIDGELMARRALLVDASLAYAWLTELGIASAKRGASEAAVVRSTVESTVAAVERSYAMAAAEAHRLREAAAQLIELADRVPLVMMHGDPTSGNAVRRADGRIAFLDWESATPDGLPLWDVFHFARSHRLDVARLRRLARRPHRLVTALWTDPTLERAVADYVRLLEIPPAAVKPLFITGWAHRAVKEVSRLPADGLGRGRYIGLLRAALEAL